MHLCKPKSIIMHNNMQMSTGPISITSTYNSAPSVHICVNYVCRENSLLPWSQ